MTVVISAACLSPSLTLGEEADRQFVKDVKKMLVREAEKTSRKSAEPLPTPELRGNQADDLRARHQLLLGAARNATSQGNVDLALRRYEAVLNEFPGDDETRFELAGLLMRWGKWRQAEDSIRELLETDPGNDEYQEILADILIQRQKLAEATKLLWDLSERSELSLEVAVRLARLLAWQKEFDRAEKLISPIADSEELMPADLRLGLAQYFIESNQPKRAIQVATSLSKQGIEQIEIDVVLARANTELGKLDEAYEYVRRMGQLSDQDLRIRLDLADDFYRAGHDRLALAVFKQVLDLGHSDSVVMSKVARAQTRLLDLPAAEATLQDLVSNPSFTEAPEFQAARADFLVATGRHAEAERYYRSLIQSDPSDVDLQNGYGHLWFSAGDYLRAETEYRTALAKGPGSVKTTIFLARTLANSQRIDEAIEVLSDARNDGPESANLLLPLVETMAAAGRHSDVLALCEEELTKTTSYLDRMRILSEMGFAQMRLGKLHDAGETFRTVLREYDSLSPRATYGLWRVHRLSGNSFEAETILANFDRDVGDDLSRRMQLADLATADCDGRLAERVLLPALEASPENTLLLIRLGEAVGLTDRVCGTCRDRRYFLQALALQPDNTRAQLGLARSYARSRHVNQSVHRYTALLQDFPGHRPANLELSRLTHLSSGVDAGMVAYGRAQQRLDAAHSQLGTELVLEDEDEQLIVEEEWASDEFANFDVHHIDFEYLEGSLVSLEKQAKCYQPWRPRAALCFYRSLVAADRSHEEGQFDLGQVYGAMDYTAAAAQRFRQVLAINPCHHEARIALRRTCLERSPQSWSDISIFDEEGRDGLTDITRTRVSTLGRYPLGDENEYIYGGYAHEWLNGDFGSEVQANLALVGARRRICDFTSLFVDAEIGDYSEGFTTRPQFRAGVRYRDRTDVVWTVNGFLENVISNRESINQDIYVRGLEISALVPHSWRWNVLAAYRWGNYSDDNNSHEAILRSEYLLCHGCGRRQWRSIVDGYFRNLDEETIPGPDPLSLAGTIHPYWAPQGFAHVSLGFEYKRWLSRYNFKYANQWWWSAYLGGRVDTDGEGYGLAALRCHRDHCNWLSTGIDGSLVQSPVYDNAGIRAYLIVRLN